MSKIVYKGQNNFHYPLFILTILIAVFGIVMVYSASSYNAERIYGNAMFFTTKQIIGVAIGIFVMIGCYFIDYKVLEKLWLVALILGLAILGIVFIPGVGIESYGAKRWINLGIFSFQASEVAKFCFIIFAATYMAKYQEKMTSFVGILPVLCAGGLMCLLIILEPNMSITMCVGMLMIIMLVVGGMRLKHLSVLGAGAVCLVPALIVLEPYRLKRLMAFVNPWANPQGEGFQLIQSLYSLGAGGWFGVGLLNSRQKYAFLPFSESDFIFSIIGEEFGFLGCVFLVLAFGLLLYYGIKIAINAKDRFGCYLAVGITAILGIQVVLNVAVVSGAVPPTGLPLPLVSAGSTSIVMFMAAIGVLLNIHRQSTMGIKVRNYLFDFKKFEQKSK